MSQEILHPVPDMSMTVQQLAKQIGATVHGDGSYEVEACATLQDARPQDVSFLANRKYLKWFSQTKAGVVIVSSQDIEHAPHRTLLVADDPYFAFRQATVALHGFRKHPHPLKLDPSNLVAIDPTATIGQGCTIYPMAYISAQAKIGHRCVIYPYCFIGPKAVIGDDCVLYPSVTIYDDCVLGNRVVLHSGCVVGQDGFGYATHNGAHHKIPQVGNVVIEDDVEMGAGCVVDRATVGTTRIAQGTKFSDLVAIGHGAEIGKHNLFVAQVGIGGSTQTGDYVVLGGQAGVAGHLKIGNQVRVAAKAGVADDLPPEGLYGGQPAQLFSQTKRSFVAVARLPEMITEFRKMQKRLAQLEAQLDLQTDSTP